MIVNLLQICHLSILHLGLFNKFNVELFEMSAYFLDNVGINFHFNAAGFNRPDKLWSKTQNLCESLV